MRGRGTARGFGTSGRLADGAGSEILGVTAAPAGAVAPAGAASMVGAASIASAEVLAVTVALAGTVA